MRYHHTKSKGDLGVLKAQVALYEQGYLPLFPHTEHACFDIAGYRNGVFKRVQVKYCKSKKGTISVRFSSCWNDRHGTHIKQMEKDEVDLVCVYCPCVEKCYWLDPKKFGNNSATLRVKTPKNNQKTKIHWANDYLQIP